MSSVVGANAILHVRQQLSRITGYELKDDKLIHKIIDYSLSSGSFRLSEARRLALVGDMALQNAVMENWWPTGRPTST